MRTELFLLHGQLPGIILLIICAEQDGTIGTAHRFLIQMPFTALNRQEQVIPISDFWEMEKKWSWRTMEARMILLSEQTPSKVPPHGHSLLPEQLFPQHPFPATVPEQIINRTGENLQQAALTEIPFILFQIII